jgi:hypothetical protein
MILVRIVQVFIDQILVDRPFEYGDLAFRHAV